MLTSCHSKGNKEIMHVCGVGAQYPAEGVHQPSDYCGPATPTGVNKQADERSCRGTLKRELTVFYFHAFFSNPHMKTKNKTLLGLLNKMNPNPHCFACK